MFTAFTYPIGLVCRVAKFNRCVSVNNWLLSTSPQLNLDTATLQLVTDAVRKRFPTHAILFRCVDASDDALRSSLTQSGYRCIVNRPVHWWYPKRWGDLPKGRRRLVRADLRQWEREDVSLGSAESISSTRMTDLYRSLYISKHSDLNAIYTPRFMDACKRSKLFSIDVVLDAEARAVGFAAFFETQGRVVFSYLGYEGAGNGEVPVKNLYQLLVGRGYQRSLDSQLDLFLSTGASAFKLLRGSIEALECEGVMTDHLPAYRALPWLFVGGMFGLGARTLNSSDI